MTVAGSNFALAGGFPAGGVDSAKAGAGIRTASRARRERVRIVVPLDFVGFGVPI
jgi:hypothetical protein